MSLAPVSFRRPVEPQPRLSKPYVPGRRSKRYWTDAEKEIVRKYYPKGGASACAAHLPGRPLQGIYNQAKALGLKRPEGAMAYGTAPPKDRHPELDAKIREAWPQLDGKKRGAVNGLADKLDVPRWWLTKRAQKLGLTMPHKKEPPWTRSELLLLEKVPLHNLDKCAEIFRAHGYVRTPNAIKVKATRLRLSRRYRETFSATSAAPIVGMDPKTVTLYILDGSLKATKRVTKRLPQQGGHPWSISRADLRAFVIEHLERIDLRKVEKFAFVDLLVNQREEG